MKTEQLTDVYAVDRFKQYKSFSAYHLERTPKSKEYTPPLEKQLEVIAEYYYNTFHIPPPVFFIGPIKDNNQTYVHEGIVYIPVIEAGQQATPIKGHDFTTAYISTDPSQKISGG